MICEVYDLTDVICLFNLENSVLYNFFFRYDLYFHFVILTLLKDIQNILSPTPNFFKNGANYFH